MKQRNSHLRRRRENAILVGVELPSHDRSFDVEYSLDELERLAETAGAKVVHKFRQQLRSVTPATLIGRGKVEEIQTSLSELHPDLIIVDEDLSPAQQRNLEAAFKIRVIDRSQLILDIFAQRARSNEGKLQVELAQLEYLLPRLTRQWTHLSRLGGGIGTRGPGETQLEVDRRRIRERISHLKRRLKTVERTRALHRKERDEVPFTMVALVGYTNAGKSTLMNMLTRAGVFVENKLFATLDPTTRALRLPNGNITATCPLHSSNDLTHGVALSCAQINGSVLAALEHVLERCHVRLGEIHYMRVVADCRAVGCGVIRPVNLECRLLPQRCLNGEWNKMSFR